MNYAIRSLFILLLGPLGTGQIFGNKDGDPSHAFIPNEGQWDRRVEYKADIPGGKFFRDQKGFTYLLNDYRHGHGKKSSSPHTRINFHSIKVRFPGSTGPASVREKGPSSYPVNYYLSNDPKNWATGLRKYEELHFEKFYDGIDMRLQGTKRGLKYEFHLEAGTDPDAVQMLIKGASSLKVENGRLRIGTSLRPIIEENPIAYQTVNGKRQEIPCRFELKGDTVSFAFPEGYNKDQPLVIDPEVVFASYSGSTADNWGNTATYDDAGNFYGGGTVFATGFPTTNGAYQEDFAGGEGGIIAQGPNSSMQLISAVPRTKCHPV